MSRIDSFRISFNQSTKCPLRKPFDPPPNPSSAISAATLPPSLSLSPRPFRNSGSRLPTPVLRMSLLFSLSFALGRLTFLFFSYSFIHRSKSHRFLGKTYLPKEFDENEVVELPLRHLAYNNVHVPIEFTFRKDERAATDSNATEPASLEPYWTREFVDVWTST